MSRTRSSTQPQQRNAPSVALGGATNQNSYAPVNGQSSRTSSRNQGGASNFQPSVDVSRSWDRGSSHTWNHHHYRWNDGNWVIIDGGGYGYPYGYANGYNSGRMYDSQSLAASVQARLARQGYNPGPADGVIGGQTRQAIADFQNDHRLQVTGQIDGPLLQTMGLD
ncbi:MAG: peptidoglycan-binding domain-containing protein [Chthoniobacter sp.]|nr:peptidoglycan-binding domain-containing protein [Chthoniobacter sp.]